MGEISNSYLRNGQEWYIGNEQPFLDSYDIHIWIKGKNWSDYDVAIDSNGEDSFETGEEFIEFLKDKFNIYENFTIVNFNYDWKFVDSAGNEITPYGNIFR